MKIGNSLFSLLAAVCMLFVFSGCYYDVEEELYPPSSNACDTSTVTYSATIAKIMNDNCNVCHGASSAQGGVVLDNYTDVQIHAADGSLMGSIKQTDLNFSPMPKGGGKLSDCDIVKLDKWIREGSLNN